MIVQPYRERDFQRARDLRGRGFHGKKKRCLQEAKLISKALAKRGTSGSSALRKSAANANFREEDRLLMALYPRRDLTSK
jgi:hypothetical protein